MDTSTHRHHVAKELACEVLMMMRHAESHMPVYATLCAPVQHNRCRYGPRTACADCSYAYATVVCVGAALGGRGVSTWRTCHLWLPVVIPQPAESRVKNTHRQRRPSRTAVATGPALHLLTIWCPTRASLGCRHRKRRQRKNLSTM